MTDETGIPNPPDDGIPVKRGKIQLYSERDNGRPFTDCLICSAMSCLRWMGYVLPNSYHTVIREATGVPNTRGLTLNQVQRAIESLFIPATTLETLSESDFLGALKQINGRGKGKSVFAIVVDTGKLPPHYQRWVGQSYDGLHGLAVAAKTGPMNAPDVFILDPMAKTKPGKLDLDLTFQPYSGELIPWDLLKPAIRGAEDGTITCIRGVKNGARVDV
jgi:hypothetical protein